jgi:hypothetical protein
LGSYRAVVRLPLVRRLYASVATAGLHLETYFRLPSPARAACTASWRISRRSGPTRSKQRFSAVDARLDALQAPKTKQSQAK